MLWHIRYIATQRRSGDEQQKYRHAFYFCPEQDTHVHHLVDGRRWVVG
jgi:hypothetical protein